MLQQQKEKRIPTQRLAIFIGVDKSFYVILLAHNPQCVTQLKAVAWRDSSEGLFALIQSDDHTIVMVTDAALAQRMGQERASRAYHHLLKAHLALLYLHVVGTQLSLHGFGKLGELVVITYHLQLIAWKYDRPTIGYVDAPPPTKDAAHIDTKPFAKVKL